MVYPAELNPNPSILLLAIGGVVGTILLSSLIYLAPVLGLPSIDVPLLVGGIFTTFQPAAFWIGFAVFFFVGVFIFAPALTLAWVFMPGRGVGLSGALLKGLLWGGGLWLLGGLMLPLFALLNRVEGVEDPGFFAIRLGLLGAGGFLAGHLLYGVVIALTTATSHGIMPMETIGWHGHGRGNARQIGIEPHPRPGHDAPGEKPKAVRS
ncbi:MAG: hypothetical protein KY432_11815 [Acidobacteria bacterium]|nr:hypothetical protein [Acidobacteriota bacterium]